MRCVIGWSCHRCTQIWAIPRTGSPRPGSTFTSHVRVAVSVWSALGSSIHSNSATPVPASSCSKTTATSKSMPVRLPKSRPKALFATLRSVYAASGHFRRCVENLSSQNSLVTRSKHGSRQSSILLSGRWMPATTLLICWGTAAVRSASLCPRSSMTATMTGAETKSAGSRFPLRSCEVSASRLAATFRFSFDCTVLNFLLAGTAWTVRCAMPSALPPRASICLTSLQVATRLRCPTLPLTYRNRVLRFSRMR